LPSRQRRALSHLGGEIEFLGEDETLRDIARRALETPAEEEAARQDVHGFHAYPARLHPLTARALVEGLSHLGDHVLDPFAGSGTVAVETVRAGRHALGSDLNPVAVALARLKATPTSASFRETLLAAAQQVWEFAEERRLAKARPTIAYGTEDRELFSPHVLLELDGLRSGIESLLRDVPVRRAALLVLSAVISKVSTKRGDAAHGLTTKRHAGGFTLRFFVAKTRELAERLAAFAAAVPPGTPAPQFWLQDARRLESVPTGSVRLIVSSPPYPGVYDYHEHHAARMRWLRMEGEPFLRGELGSRRQLQRLTFAEAIAEWERQFLPCLREMRRVLTPGGHAALILADSTLGRRAVRAAELTSALAERAGLSVALVASQARPHFHLGSQDAFSQTPRREHLLILRAQERGPSPGVGRAPARSGTDSASHRHAGAPRRRVVTAKG